MASFFYKQEAGREHSGKGGQVLVPKERLIQEKGKTEDEMAGWHH